MTKRIKLTKALRFAAFERDNWTCRACGCHDETGKELQGDHIRPVTEGGENKLANLQTLCGVCNNAKQAVMVKLPKREAPDMNMTLAQYKQMVNENREVFVAALARKRIKKKR